MESVLVTANRRFTAVIKDGKLLLPHSVDPGPWQVALKPTVAGVLRAEKGKALVRTRLGPLVEKGILVGTTSPHNWYSWLWDILPSCFLATKLGPSFDDWPILLPESALVSPQWLEPLKLIIGSRPTLTLSPSYYSQVKNLLWIDSPNCPGPLPIEPHPTARFRLHRSAYRDFRAFVLEKFDLDPSAPSVPGKKTFIARGSGAHRPYNQDQLIEVAQRYGYSAVFFEELSFEQTVRTMFESSHVVGAHGAGWTSAAFCRPGTRGLMWTWPASKQDNWYANVANVPGIDFRVIETQGTPSNPFELAPEILSSELERLA
jgi:capsular polysaccharide biosynthesis protein